MFKHSSPVYRGIALALTGYTAFAFSDTCTKVLLGRYNIYQVITIDNVIAALLLLAIAPRLGGTKDLWKRKNLKIHGLRTLLNLAINITLAFCFMHFSLATVYTMVFTKPFFAALLAMPLYGEMLNRSRLTAILLGFAGVLITLRPGTEGFNPMMVLPLLVALAAALMFVCARSLKNPSLFSLGFIPMIGVSIFTAPLMMPHFIMPPLADLPIFALSGFCMGAGLMCVSLAFRTTAASVVAPFMYTEMVWALIFGLLIFGDWPNIWMLAGAFVIIASGVYLVETERRGTKHIGSDF
jgi:drug/metabolite transporter (DMT)-like permease